MKPQTLLKPTTVAEGVKVWEKYGELLTNYRNLVHHMKTRLEQEDNRLYAGDLVATINKESAASIVQFPHKKAHLDHSDVAVTDLSGTELLKSFKLKNFIAILAMINYQLDTAPGAEETTSRGRTNKKKGDDTLKSWLQEEMKQLGGEAALKARLLTSFDLGSEECEKIAARGRKMREAQIYGETLSDEERKDKTAYSLPTAAFTGFVYKVLKTTPQAVIEDFFKKKHDINCYGVEKRRDEKHPCSTETRNAIVTMLEEYLKKHIAETVGEPKKTLAKAS